jgi:hypothetical protein
MIFSILSDQAAVAAGQGDSRTAQSVAVALGVVLWSGWLVFVADGGLYGKDSSGYWVALAVIGSFPVWSMTESYAYWRRMKRRLAIGLADPLVCNRFLLWTLASISSLGSIWIVNVPVLLRPFVSEADLPGLTVVSLLVTAVFGLGTVGMYWLTFFPPAWYRGRVLAATAASHA